MRRLKKDFSQVAQVQLLYLKGSPESKRIPVTNSEDAYELLMQTWEKEKLEVQEQFRVVLLDENERCIGISTRAEGDRDKCPVDLKSVFALALNAKASSLILAHNHPNGTRNPSVNDLRLTDRFALAARVLDLLVLDHLIVTKDGYTSFTDENLFFTLPPEERKPGG